jgi:hypothetical protein
MTSKIGAMRCNFKLKNYPEAIKSAMQVLIYTEDAKQLEREVHYTIGKSFYETKDYEGAYAEFLLIADQAKSSEGAEANYRIIEIDFNNKEYDKATDLIHKFKNSNSPHQEWVARSFMIWSDIFKIKEDFFMAKATLESIIKYYPNNEDGVKSLAEEKLADIYEIEVDNEALEEATEIEINMFNEEDTKLFDEDLETETDSINNTEIIEPEKTEKEESIDNSTELKPDKEAIEENLDKKDESNKEENKPSIENEDNTGTKPSMKEETDIDIPDKNPPKPIENIENTEEKEEEVKDEN